MLLQFKVENFKSFKNTAVLSMEASSERDLFENTAACCSTGKKRVLKTAALFGANASGKSNIFHALTAAITAVRTSGSRQPTEPILSIVPFKFDAESVKLPTSFEFVFIAEGKKYVYGFSATTERVESEYLYVYNSSKASTVFARKDVNRYTFTSPALKRELEPLTARNTENKFFLSTAAAWNCQAAQAPFRWFAKGINTYSADYESLFPRTALSFDNDNDRSLCEFTKRILREADINIDDYRFETEDIPRGQFLQRFLQNFGDEPSSIQYVADKAVKIETIHKIFDGNSPQQFALPFDEESDGTKSLFMLAPVLKSAFESGETVCIDEFGTSLHPMLERYIFSLFNNTELNRANAQLIISTHSMALMSSDILRRDQIYFVDKDRKSGVSELYSLDDFSVRSGENIRKAYLLGRFGAVPEIAEEVNL